MSRRTPLVAFLVGAVGAWVAGAAPRKPDEVVPLWPGVPPGISRATGPERKVEGRPRPFYQLTEIATPVLEVFLPSAAGQRNGTAVLVCPGGGLQRLAYEHEGLEVADWLNSIGLTAIVLKYRLPAPAETALLDAQRAMGIVRQNAGQWQIDPAAVGFLGFSAGGEIGAWLVSHADARGYPAIDEADRASCRPNFAGLIYSGGLLQSGGVIKEAIATNLTERLPPVFLAHALDDAADNSLQFALALKRARVPFELHIYQEGAHGFGVRATGVPADDWRERFREWLAVAGHFDAPGVRAYAAEFVSSRRQPPVFTSRFPESKLADAYAAQRRIVRHDRVESAVAGYKGAAASAAAQTALKIDAPLIGVLFKGGQLSAAEALTIDRAGVGAPLVEIGRASCRERV